jgi:hypothetical protein
MNLSVDFSVLTAALSQMGTTPINFDIKTELGSLADIDIGLSKGFEVDFKDIEFDTGLACYEGRQVLLYIKDHSYNNKIYGVLKDGTQGNKFHVADCEMLERMRQNGRFDRYVVTNKLNGKFAVAGTDNQTNELIEGETKLNVCQFCLEAINYQKFATIKRGPPRKSFVQGFQLAEFFDTYSSFFKFMPTGIANNQTTHYTDDWKDVSKKVRIKFDYQCQQCGVDLSQHKSLLHVHHINGVKSDNSASNLTPLCCDCHRKQPDHQHMFTKHDETKRIAQLRNAQGLNTKESWKDIYKLADPGVHGVIDLLEKHHVSLPEVGEEIVNDKQEVAAELELAWPLKKVGIAIDKAEAIAATKLGWKVYSMRFALSEIDTLAQSLR